MADLFRALRESGGLSALGSAMQSTQQAALQREQGMFDRAVTLEKLNIVRAGEARAAEEAEADQENKDRMVNYKTNPLYLSLADQSKELVDKSFLAVGAADELGVGRNEDQANHLANILGEGGDWDELFDEMRKIEISKSEQDAASAFNRVQTLKDKKSDGEQVGDALLKAEREARRLDIRAQGVAGTFTRMKQARDQARATREAATTKGKSGDIAKAQKRISDIGKAELSIRSGGSDDTIMAIMAKIDPTGAAKARLAAFDGPIADEAIRLLNVEKLQLINTLPTNLREHYISTEKVGESAPSLGSTAALRAAEGGAPIPQEGRELTPAEEKAMKEQGLEFTGRFSPDGKPIFLKDGREGTLK